MRYKPELDGIRGVAIIGVLATHSYAYIQETSATKPLLTLMAFGGWGVDLFFALSGFLITGILLETKSATNYLGSFYGRRFLRIFPLYYSVLAILFLWASLSPWAAANMPEKADWAAYLVYLQNVPHFWKDGFVTGHMMSHFWSLAVEEQFYLVWPFVILVLPEVALLWVCGGLLALALPLRIYMVQHVFGFSWAQMIVTPSRMDGLFVGAACILLLRKRRSIPLSWILLSAGTGLSLLLWILLFHRRTEASDGGLFIRTFGVSAIALLCGSIIAMSQRDLPHLRRFLSQRSLRFFGRYSYGIYVIHVPIYDLTSRLIAPKLGISVPLPVGAATIFIVLINAIAIGIAVLSYRYFESPFLQLKSRWAPRWSESSERDKSADALELLGPPPGAQSTTCSY